MPPDDASTWDGARYAAQSTHHRAFDDAFLARHTPAPADTIVDVGCGPGAFTLRLAEEASLGRAIGVEPDPSMLAEAQTLARDNLTFLPGRAEELDAVLPPASADLVVSRAVLHWIPLAGHPRCYTAIHTVLRPGGWLHLDFGGAGNVGHLAALLDDIAARNGLGPRQVTFPDPGMVLEMIEQAGFDVPPGGVQSVAQRRRFDRDQLLGFLRTQAALAFTIGAPADAAIAFLAGVEDNLDRFRRHDGSWDQTFVRIDALAQRPR